ncbi:MAG: hypothetical protein AAB966_00805, partial [Patescibacteria group bacterium]
PGTKAARTNEFIMIPAGDELFGSIIDPLGNPMSASKPFKKPKDSIDIEGELKSIAYRARIKKNLVTGTTLVDMLIPIGVGQRELIIGDRKTGKTAFLYTIVKKQVQDGAIVIVAAIGKKQTDIKHMYEVYEKDGLLKQMVIVASGSDSSPALTFLTPFSAMALAEYYRDRGRDVVLILDDLSTHAKFYRELSLIAGGFPGKDAYPGDMFHLHARLLERAGNFTIKDGEAAISCFPVVETVDGELAGHIATNVMGVTDGHIFFDVNAYTKGRRPAIHIGLSVSRVGRQTQSNLEREIGREIIKFFAQYERVLTFSHFGAELSTKVKNMIKKGDVLYELFDQHYAMIVPKEIQLIMFGLIWLDTFAEVDLIEIGKIRNAFIVAFQDKKKKKLFDDIIKADTIYNLLTNISNKKEELMSYAQPQVSQK